MEKAAYQYITETVEKFLFEHGFKAEDGDLDYYSDGTRAVSIAYDESTGLLKLRTAELEEGQSVVWRDISSWLFGENSDERDQKNIANDYVDTLSGLLSVKTASKVSLPSKVAKGSTMTVDAFTARFLDIHTALKAVYKEEMEKNGEFLYDTFYRTHGIEAINNTLSSNNKKQITKCFAFLSEAFVDGDQNVKAVVVYNLLCGIFLKDKKLKEDMEQYLEKHIYLKGAVDSMLSVMSSEKSRKKYLMD